MTTEIELQNVSHCFGGRKLFENIHLEIKKGEKLVLIGPSGHGKSILLKIMAGIIAPTMGNVLIRGQNLLTMRGKARDQLQRKMGMLFQRNALFDSLTVFENVAFPLRETSALSEIEINDRVEFYLSAVGIESFKNNFPDEISGGMQKRLGIARALALEPEIIFYDDPTAGLDPITSRKIVDLILGQQKKKNSTIIAVTNEMNRAFQIADSMGMIISNQFVSTGTVQETKNSKDPRISQFIRGQVQGPLVDFS